MAGPGVATHRFDHDRSVDADLLGLPPREKMEIRAGNDDRRRKHRILHTQEGLLVGRPVADQWQKLLGQGIPRNRPKPGPGAAGQQNGDDR